jgi:hypothetical protein
MRRFGASFGKGTSGRVKFSAAIDRMRTGFGGKLLNSLRTMIQFLQSVKNVYVPFSPK